MDFRTVHLTEIICRNGAPNIDSSPKGTSLRDFLRSKDLAPMPEDLVASTMIRIPHWSES